MASMHALAVLSERKQFPDVGMEVLSSVIHLIGVSIISFMLSMKVDLSEISSFSFNNVSWPKLLIILNLLDSWAFMFTTGILVHGTGMELSGTVCMMGILNCIIFYASSKVIIYLFLAEKVYVVWNVRRRRLHSKVYIACLAVIGVYVGVIVFLIFGRIAFFRDDGACVIGLTRPASLTLLIYDLLINVLLTSLFVWPLLHRQFTPALKGVAVRTLWAAGVALTTSCINILVLTIMHGQQLAWVCLASCGTDVVINAIVLCWVTSSKYEQGTEHSRDPSSHGGQAFASNVLFYSTASGDRDFSPREPASAPPLTAHAPRSRFPRVFPRGEKRAPPPAAGAGTAVSAYTHSQSVTMHGPDDGVELMHVSKILERDAERGVDEDEDGDDEEDRKDRARVYGRELPVPVVVPTPLLDAPTRAVRRNNTVLGRHAPGVSGTELQIVVTQETDVMRDAEMVSPPLTKSPSPPSSSDSDEKW